jgi:hypothetical protein
MFETIMHNLMQLEDLTEQKIQATVMRDSSRLLQLLQEELDPLTRVNRHLLSMAGARGAARPPKHPPPPRGGGRRPHIQ